MWCYFWWWEFCIINIVCGEKSGLFFFLVGFEEEEVECCFCEEDYGIGCVDVDFCCGVGREFGGGGCDVFWVVGCLGGVIVVFCVGWGWFGGCGGVVGFVVFVDGCG